MTARKPKRTPVVVKVLQWLTGCKRTGGCPFGSGHDGPCNPTRGWR